MDVWRCEIKKGLRHLSRHEPDRALSFFRSALEGCPVSESRALSRLLFYIGITLKRLGCTDSAVKSWLLAYRLTKNSFAYAMIKRYANTYGMAKQDRGDRDDWRAFYSLQLARYLNAKKRRQFYFEAERDMVRDLIFDHWVRLREQYPTEGMSPEEKERLFERTVIVFPFVVIPEALQNPVIHVDFRRNRKLEPQDRCPCGSGLSFMLCCGRIPGERELLSGTV